MKNHLKENWNNIYNKAEDFVISALEVGISKKTAQSFFDDAWNKAEGYEDWIWESKKSNRKSIRENNDTLVSNNYKDVYTDRSNESIKRNNKRLAELITPNILEDKNMNKEIKTDFDVLNEDFYLNYYTNNLKGWICVDLYKDDISVESHFEKGDYYGPENDSGPLPGGYYGRGYEIDNIDIPTEYMNELFFDEDDNEITKEEFLTLNNMSEKDLNSYLNAAKDELSSEIEDYIYSHEDEFIGE